ncbi:AAA family ATPase, partial [Vibrio cholerae]
SEPEKSLNDDETLDFDDLELPEYSEDDALADMANEPATSDPEQSLSDDETLDFDDLELPEYSEDDALADMANEPATPESEKSVSDDETFDFDDLELPEYNEDDALADLGDEPSIDLEEKALAPSADSPQEEQATESVDTDELELPEYNEDDALADMASEPMSDDQGEPVGQELTEFDELELPEYGEDEALADMPTTDGDAESADEVNFNLDDLETPELSEIPSERRADIDVAEAMAAQEFDEQAFDELLADSEDATPSFSFDSPIDATTSDSAGMDIDAMLEMGGEDWNGFTLSPEQQAQISDDIPEEERGVWDQDNAPEQPEVSDEDWSIQDSADDFSPQQNQFRTIDELMAEVEMEEQQELDDELKLDVGLNDFPDVIGDIGDEIDVDSNAEAAGKLDLAKIYVEMNDAQGAIKLLEEAIVDGSDEIRREAKRLIDKINRG